MFFAHIYVFLFVFQACVEKPFVPPNMVNLYKTCHEGSIHFDFFHKSIDTALLVSLFPINCSNSLIDEKCSHFVVELTFYDDMRMINRLDSFHFELSDRDIKCHGNVCSFQISFKFKTSLCYVHVKILNPCKDLLYWHFDVVQRNNIWRQHLLFQYPNSTPILSGYVKTHDTFQIITDNNVVDKLYVFQAFSSNDIPEKPFIFLNYSRKTPKWQYVQTITHTEMLRGIAFQQKGLYFFSVDSILNEDGVERGRGLLVVERSFPFISDTIKMLEPMMYLLHEYEYGVLKSSHSLQKAIEMFWIKNSKSIDDAQLKMQKFYQRVEEANMMFTIDREGWSTDRGMIYIICGHPTFIQRAPGFERWFYGSERSLFSTMFEFYKTQALSKTGDYFLFRYPQYQEFWEKNISAWRK